MDTFTEQLVLVKKDTKTLIFQTLLWVCAALLSFGFFMLAQIIMPLYYVLIIIIAALFYGAYKLSARANIEFEYDVTNSDIDIDMIISKSQRKRAVSFKCSDIEKTELFDPKRHNKANYKNIIICCDTAELCWAVTVTCDNGSKKLVVMAPDERTVAAITKTMSYVVKKDAFNGN